MEYKLSEATDTMTHTRPVNWITAITASRSKDKKIYCMIIKAVILCSTEQFYNQWQVNF